MLLDRVAEFLMLGAIATMRGGEGGPRCSRWRGWPATSPTTIDDAPVFAAIRGLLDAFDESTRRPSPTTAGGWRS